MDFNTHLITFNIVGITDCVCMDFTIFQFNTGSNLIHIRFCQILIQINMVDFLLQELRMRQLRSQIAIIRQQQHTSSITVQTSYRIDTFATSSFHKIHYSKTRLRIIRSSHTIFRLIQQHIHLTFNAYRFIMELHDISTFDLSTQFRYHFTIHRNNAGCDKFIGFTT